MKVLRAGDYKRMPWKNGGGETVEIAVFPEGAGLAEFDWRISMATVASDGPFSVFPGIERTLSILDGTGMTLSVEGQAPVRLTQESPPLIFSADTPTSATLLDGEITDLNVMTRRSVLMHTVERFELAGEITVEATAPTTLLFCKSGRVAVVQDGEQITLNAHDCLLTEKHKALTLSGDALCFLVAIRRSEQSVSRII
ncbi:MULTISPECIES: HutD family protein [unclassified Sinorhizobium]|uniref:HutD/Ves family protein n=1 Tax=unclassified Sinorhizobium TaxID=2613772 RepID=UPI0035233012